MLILSLDLIALPQTQWDEPYLCIQRIKLATGETEANIYVSTKQDLYTLFGPQGSKIQVGRMNFKQITVQGIIPYLEYIDHLFNQHNSTYPPGLIIEYHVEKDVAVELFSLGLKGNEYENSYIFENIPLNLVWHFKDKWIKINVQGKQGNNVLPTKANNISRLNLNSNNFLF